VGDGAGDLRVQPGRRAGAALRPDGRRGWRAHFGRSGSRPCGQTLNGYTATLNLKPMAGLLVRPEVRYDFSSELVFDGHDDQWTPPSLRGVYWIRP
jgi:hypothetical protein